MTTQPKSQPGYDGEPPEFMPTRDLVSIDKWTGKRVREVVDGPTNTNSSRVSWLFNHGHISKAQYEAADQLANDYQMALIVPYAQMAVIAGSNGRSDYTPAQAKIEAMQRLNRALQALGAQSSAARRVIDLVVIQNVSVQKAAASMRVHQQRAQGMLLVALDVLASHYRIL